MFNEVSSELHRLTGVEQRVTSAYHPQANGLVERQNRTIKNSLIKVLGDKPAEWPFIVEGVLFAHRVSKHSSTKYSPFKLLYNREPVLPVDIKYQLSEMDLDENEPFDRNVFDSVLSSSAAIIKKIHKQAEENIKKAQEKQKKDYLKRHGNTVNDICVGVEVLLRNNKRKDRKGGKFCYKWIGPYVVSHITKKGVATLRNNNGLEKKYNITHLKLFIHGDEENLDQTTESPDEKPVERPNYWDALPNEIVEKILMESIKSSNQKCVTYNSIMNTCKRFQMIKEPGKKVLPKIYINRDIKYQTLPDGDLIVSVRSLLKTYGQGSGLLMQIAEIIQLKTWKSAWLTLSPEKLSWYTIKKFYWKKANNTVTNVDNVSLSKTWIKNDHYHLKEEDKDILQKKDEWLNDNLIDAAQKLICQVTGKIECYQSALNSQKKSVPYYPVGNEHLQLLHDGANHWLLSCNFNGGVHVLGSLRTNLSVVTKRWLKALYKPLLDDNRKLVVTFFPVNNQNDGFNCRLYAIAFAADIINGLFPMDSQYDVNKMRQHLIKCLENERLDAFPKLQKQTNVNCDEKIKKVTI